MFIQTDVDDAFKPLPHHFIQTGCRIMHCLLYATRPRSAVSYMPPRHGGVVPVLRTGNESTHFFQNYMGRYIHIGSTSMTLLTGQRRNYSEKKKTMNAMPSARFSRH